MFLETDIVPDPPDGPPVIEAITGKTITLSWKTPKRLDPSLGRFITYLQAGATQVDGYNVLEKSCLIKSSNKESA